MNNMTVMTAPFIKPEVLHTLFIEMTAKNCGSRCKNCYINFDKKNPKDFIPFEKIKQTIKETENNLPEYICFTGAEPMLHPEFNKILRYCLNYRSVIIYTNASCINDKKARFLKNVEEENNSGNEIIFMISLDSINEAENDEIRGRGAYRKSVHAMQSLIKYDFNPIITIVNYKNRKESEIKEEFSALCSSFGFETSDINFKIIPYMKKDAECEYITNFDTEKFRGDCKTSKTLTADGIYACPLLTSDYRGRYGKDLIRSEEKIYLETPYCSQCMKYNTPLFEFGV